MDHAVAVCLGVFFPPLLLWHQLLDIISNVTEKGSFLKGWLKTEMITFDSCLYCFFSSMSTTGFRLLSGFSNTDL